TQVECIRAAKPSLERVVVYCRDEGRREAFAREVAAEAGETHRDAAEQDSVVTITTRRDPGLRGAWLRPGALARPGGPHLPAAREARGLARAAGVADVGVFQDLVQRAPALVLADEVGGDAVLVRRAREQKGERISDKGCNPGWHAADCILDLDAASLPGRPL